MSPLAARPSSLLGSDRAEFTLFEFEKLITDHGYLARWSKALFCPNKDPNQDDHHRLACTLCDNNGFVYHDPTELRTHVTSFGARQLFMPESRYHPGTAYFTTLPAHKLGFWDKMELLDSTARFSQAVKRVSNVLNYKMKYPVVSLVKVLTSEGTDLPVAGITVEPDGSITFANAPDGVFFSVSYFYRPVYIMMDLLHQIRDSRITLLGTDEQVDFPSQAVGQLDFLVRDDESE